MPGIVPQPKCWGGSLPDSFWNFSKLYENWYPINIDDNQYWEIIDNNKHQCEKYKVYVIKKHNKFYLNTSNKLSHDDIMKIIMKTN